MNNDDLDPSLWGDPFAYYALALEKQDLPATPNDGLIDNECDDEDDEASCEDKQAEKTKRKAQRENQLSKWSYTFQLHKSTTEPQVVRGVVYPSCGDSGAYCADIDTQGDYASNTDVRDAAWGFMAKLASGQARVTHEHQGTAPAVPVESYLAPQDLILDDGTHVTKGSWVGAVRINSNALWKQVENGTLNAFSIGGTGLRHVNSGIVKSAHTPTQLTNLDIDEWALVKSGANKRRFSIVRKRDGLELDFENEIERLEKTIGGTRMNQTEELRKSTDEAVAFAKDLLDQAAKGMVRKGEALTYEQAHVEVQQREPELAQIAATAPGTILIFPDDVEKSDEGYAFDEEQEVSKQEQDALLTVMQMKERFDKTRAKPDVEIKRIALQKMAENPYMTEEMAEAHAWAENPELWEEYNARQIRSVDPQSSQTQYYE